MDSFATMIGWITIICFVIFALGHFFGALENNKIKALEDQIGTTAIAYRITLRNFYNETEDIKVREEVKSWAMSYPIGGWALLELDMTDAQFETMHKQTGRIDQYLNAKERIKTEGSPLYFEGGKIKSRW